MCQSRYTWEDQEKGLSHETRSPDSPLAELEALRGEVTELKQISSDLEIMLENTTEHSTRIETELHEKNEEMEDYIRHVSYVTAAAAAFENGAFESDMLEQVIPRADQLGQLARVFQSMVAQVKQREEKLKQQVAELKIEIDQTKRIQQVAQITQSEYFQELKQKAKRLKESSDS